MENLNDQIDRYILELHEKCGDKYALDIETLKKSNSIYPFNAYEYIFAILIAENIISLEKYFEIRKNYLDTNQYLHVFEITAPRTFGENWAQKHLHTLVPELHKPSKSLHGSYVGEYDFWYENIRIEVKASRAVKRVSGGSLINKALSSNSTEGFDMNFQQLKPRYCDVFVWIGVWRDVIRYWVLSSSEVENNKYFSSGQHRGNVGEGQLWIKNTNINDFDEYLVEPNNILTKIIEKSRLGNPNN